MVGNALPLIEDLSKFTKDSAHLLVTIIERYKELKSSSASR